MQIDCRSKHGRKYTLWVWALATLWAPFAATSATAGPTFEVLYSFKSGNDGAYPFSGVITDSHGNLFGTTIAGGGASTNAGMVFKLSPPAPGHTQWTENVLHPFGDRDDGHSPIGDLFADKAGALYGVTLIGGNTLRPCSQYAPYPGCGVVFKLAPPTHTGGAWTETIIHVFAGGIGGALPNGGLIADTKGNLYGTTSGGGTGCNGQGCGVVFKLTPPTPGHTQWSYIVLHSFKGGADGLGPNGGLIIDAHGNLYGTTARGGGTFDVGTVFKLSPPAPGHALWTETVLWSFCHSIGCMDGAYPRAGLIADAKGNLYGTTEYGGGTGTVFQLAPPAPGHMQWTETVLYSFKGGVDGLRPNGGLRIDSKGNLYGTTYFGVAQSGGMVFKLSPPTPGHTQWTKTVLHSFIIFESEGENPIAGLIADSHGTLFGTTTLGGGVECGDSRGCGVVFKLSGTGFVP